MFNAKEVFLTPYSRLSIVFPLLVVNVSTQCMVPRKYPIPTGFLQILLGRGLESQIFAKKLSINKNWISRGIFLTGLIKRGV